MGAIGMTRLIARVAVRLPAALLPSEELGPDQRWRLAGSLYRQRLPLIEGSLALAALQALCWFYTGKGLFLLLAAAALLLLGIRVRYLLAFDHRSGRHTPEQWAAWFVIGAAATGMLWGSTAFLAFTGVQNPPLQAVVLIAEAGWVAGAAVRNAASPAAVWSQMLTTIVVSMAGALSTGLAIYQMTAFFYVLMFTSLLSVAHYLGQQMASQLLTEQRLADVNTKLTTACTELEQANTRLEQLSATDPLTGIGNRRAFDAILLKEWGRATREFSSVSLLLIDVDLFKAFNDFYGHPAGDAALRIIADTIEHCLRRPPDFAGRIGGEEFVALLPGVDLKGALEVAERVRSAVTETPLPHAGSPFGIVTISVGAAASVPRSGATHADLVEAADQALYRAKQSGRNRIEAAPAPGADNEALAGLSAR